MPSGTSIEVAAQQSDPDTLQIIKLRIDDGIGALERGDDALAIEHFEAALALASTNDAAHAVATHNALSAYKRCIERLLDQGDLASIQPILQRAFDLRLQGPLSHDVSFRRRFADAYYDLGKAFYRERCWEPALLCVRRAIAIEPSPAYYVDLTNALAFTKSRAQLRDYASDLAPAQLGRHLFVACAPKSGSTFLKNMLTDLTRFRDVFSVYAGLQNEQEIDLPQLRTFATENTVTQQHCRATEANIHLMQAFGIRPVVLVRDIFDTVMSLRDFYDGGFVYSTFFDRDRYVQLSEDERLDLLIAYALPWYFQFVASWQRAEREQRLDILWLDYHELTSATAATLERVLGFYGMQVSPEILQQIIGMRTTDKRSNRFNRGVAGRGKAGLRMDQREKIISLARFFPGTDFSRLGI